MPLLLVNVAPGIGSNDTRVIEFLPSTGEIWIEFLVPSFSTSQGPWRAFEESIIKQELALLSPLSNQPFKQRTCVCVCVGGRAVRDLVGNLFALQIQNYKTSKPDF